MTWVACCGGKAFNAVYKCVWSRTSYLEEEKKKGSCLQRLTPNSLSLAKIKYGNFDVQQFSAILKDWSDSPNYVRLRNTHLETWNPFTATWLWIHSHPEEQRTKFLFECAAADKSSSWSVGLWSRIILHGCGIADISRCSKTLNLRPDIL